MSDLACQARRPRPGLHTRARKGVKLWTASGAGPEAAGRAGTDAWEPWVGYIAITENETRQALD